MARFNFGTIDPDTKSGTQLATDLENQEDALHTSHKGSGRPTYAQAGMLWVDDTTPTEPILYLYDGTQDLEIARFRPSTGAFSLAPPVAGDDASPPVTTQPYQFLIDTSDANDKLLMRNGADSAWEILGEFTGTGWIPYSEGTPLTAGGGGSIVGEVRMYAPTTAPPSGWLVCDGAVVSQATYPDLWTALGTTWNTGGEAGGTFRLPDFRGRSPLGNGLGSGLTNRNVADYGGEEDHQLTVAELAAHSHGVTDPGHAHTIGDSNGVAGTTGLAASRNNVLTKPTSTATTGITVNSAGSDTPHNTMHPFAVLQFIIRATP